MTLRDGIGVLVGASLSFALGLVATAKDPTGFLMWGLIVSLCALVVVVALNELRGPWMSARVTPLEAADGFMVLRVGFTNHGYRDFGRSIVNVLVPDVVELAEWSSAGGRSTERILPAEDESVDGVHGSEYWNRALDFVQGTMLTHMSVKTDDTTLPMRIRIGNTRKNLAVDLSQVGTPHVVEFGLRSVLAKHVEGWPLVGGDPGGT